MSLGIEILHNQVFRSEQIQEHLSLYFEIHLKTFPLAHYAILVGHQFNQYLHCENY